MRAIFYATQQRIYILLSVVLAACVALSILLDLLESNLRNHSFFNLSEAFVFTSFWWLFVPLFSGQFFFARSYKEKTANILFALAAIAIHSFTYPAIVWLISATFYQHTFSYWRTFLYGLTKYGFILLIAYPAFLVLYSFLKERTAHIRSENEEKTALQYIPTETSDLPERNDFVTSILVMDGNRRTVIETKDILFFSASPPYIYIHHKTKRYLHNETLRSVVAKLDDDVFVRIHKSSIVNISKVQSYKSRLNGDYDLTITDGTELRLSRNYAAAFKRKFQKSHRDTTE